MVPTDYPIGINAELREPFAAVCPGLMYWWDEAVIMSKERIWVRRGRLLLSALQIGCSSWITESSYGTWLFC